MRSGKHTIGMILDVYMLCRIICLDHTIVAKRFLSNNARHLSSSIHRHDRAQLGSNYVPLGTVIACGRLVDTTSHDGVCIEHNHFLTSCDQHEVLCFP